VSLERRDRTQVHPLRQRARAHRHALRDWCRFCCAGTSYIEPGSPWENAYVESLGSRLRDELLSVEQFDTLLEAQVVIEDRGSCGGVQADF
jgi:hypothetical protein